MKDKNSLNCSKKKKCEKTKKEKHKVDKDKMPLTAILIKNPDYINMCKNNNGNNINNKK